VSDDQPPPFDEPAWMRQLRQMQAEIARLAKPILQQLDRAQIHTGQLRDLERFSRGFVQREDVQRALDRVGPSVSSAREAYARLSQSYDLQEINRQLRRSIWNRPDIQEALVRAGEIARAALLYEMPDNWRELGVEHFHDLIWFTVDHGIAVVWVPRAAIVTDLLVAETDAERDQILTDRRDEILDDLTTGISEVDSPKFDWLVQMARDALMAERVGLHGPAQSHIASALTGFTTQTLGYTNFRDARDFMRTHQPEAVRLAMLRRNALFHCFACTIEHTDYARYGFNRHATAHPVTDEHYNEANCLRALLLLVSLLREFSIELDVSDAEAA
jgi:hypothetical protein